MGHDREEPAREDHPAERRQEGAILSRPASPRHALDAPPSQNQNALPAQAHACKEEMEAAFARLPLSRASFPPMAELDPPLAERARDVGQRLAALIQKTADAGAMEELLGVHDALGDLLAGRYTRPKLSLLGLGLDFGAAHPGADGLAGPGLGQERVPEEEDPALLTPRVDKGKGRAQPEPIAVEKVLTPTFVLDPEDEERLLQFPGAIDEEGPLSPSSMDRRVSFPFRS